MSAPPSGPAPVEATQTNDADKPAIAEPIATSTAAEPSESTTEKLGESLTVPAGASSTNGEAKSAREDTEMKDGPATDETAAEPNNDVNGHDANKRKADTALGPEADAEAAAAGGKKAKTVEEEAGAAVGSEAAPAKPDAEPVKPSEPTESSVISAAAEANGGGAAAPLDAGAGAAAPAPAVPSVAGSDTAAAPNPDPAGNPPAPKRPGRPKKQANGNGNGKPAPAVPAGKTARKTRSQGPA